MALPNCCDDDGWEKHENLMDNRTCKICYGTDEDNKEEWTTPCKCAGTIKWVHKECLEKWVEQAPVMQKSQCNTCKFPYRRAWAIKSFEKWTLPPVRLTTWEFIEISLDVYSSVKLARGFNQVIEGKKSIISQFCYFVFWRIFIFNSRRIEYYKGLFRSLLASVFEMSIVDADS